MERAMEAGMMPMVSVIIPARNEERYIAACLTSLLRGGYPPERLEVLVVDGRSEDGTRLAVARAARRSPVPIIVVDNPRRIIPAALNLGLAHARGEIILRADAHADYPPGYIARCVQALSEHDADNVGGPVRTLPGAETPVARAIALALSHPFGVGNSAFRTATAAQEADTVPFGCLPVRVFQRVGAFDERLQRNEDYEFNQRVRRSGGRIVLDPRLACTYYSRATLGGLLRQAWANGYWNALSHALHPEIICPRHVVPLFFLLGLLLLLGAVGWELIGALPGWLWPPALLDAAAYALYGLLMLVTATRLAARHGWRLWAPLLAVFPSFHLVYGAGIATGWLAVLTRRVPWTAADATPAWNDLHIDTEERRVA
jgi:glycosyltransferase involved in cell wall biosynthesis